jgi:uncharacterized membrane protein YdbT with pleckstrin-like domain
VTVFTIWPDDVPWRRVSPRLFVIHLAGYLATVAVLGLAGGLLWYAVHWTQVWTVLAVVNAHRGPAGLRAAQPPFLGVRRTRRRPAGPARTAVPPVVDRPHGRMQFVDVTAGPLERLLGLATVQLHTAAAASDARIPGLTAAEAARLRDRLAALGEARAEGL